MIDYYRLLNIVEEVPEKVPKTNDYGYVYYNPDKKSADFRYYMEIADKLLKCLCNYPYTRKKYNLSTAFYDEHSKIK